MSIVNPPTQPMTIGRFVRVTLHNFRLLMNSISGTPPTASMPEPDDTAAVRMLVDGAPAPDSGADDPAANGDFVDAAPPEPAAAAQHAPPHADAVLEAEPAVADPIIEIIEPATVEPVAGDEADSSADAAADAQATLQPALDMATEHADALLTAETESGELLVRTGEHALAIESALECLLFVADAPVEISQLARALGAPVEVVERHLRHMADELRTAGRGLRIAERSGRFQLVTAPAAATLIETFLNLDMTTKLSAPALETLAVVAYRQPVTRAQIEAVRGVDCSGILRSLLQRGLVEEVDRLDAPGRPVLYGITDLFMHHFGLTSLHELPPLQTNETELLDNALERELP